MRRGQSLVETTLILAAFMAMILGMVSVGQMLFVRQALAERAQEAARWGAVNPYDAPAIRNLVLYGTATPSDARAAVCRIGCVGSSGWESGVSREWSAASAWRSRGTGFRARSRLRDFRHARSADGAIVRFFSGKAFGSGSIQFDV